ncbi:hypothetical protein QZM18_31150 [Burkholderia diffusa]|nr:hypothetical protein [Burkholderia diffusa]MDN7908548.1 hypothetical protein [Burkholderia diffusa]
MNARFVCLLAAEASRRDGTGVSDVMASLIARCPIAHFAAQGATVEPIA